MKERIFYYINVLVVLMLSATTIGLALQYRIGKITQAYDLHAKDVEVSIANQQADQLLSKVNEIEDQLVNKQKELEAKSAEVTKKQSELEKASKDLDSANKKVKDQQSQLSANASELSRLRDRPPLFVFQADNSSLANLEQKKQDIKDVVNAAYDVITDIYGKPYLLHSVTINFVSSFTNTNASAEISISNSQDGLSITIKLKDFDKNNFNDVNAVIHEIVHSFHGVAVFESVYAEEGITVAAADLVMEKLIADKKIPSFSPLYIRISYDTYISSTLSIPSDIYSSDKVADYYQLGGYGWREIAKADSNFLKTLNEKLYTKKREGNAMTSSLIKQAIKESTSAHVHGKSIDEWLQTKAFEF